MRNYVLNLDIECDVQMLKERLDIPQKVLWGYIHSAMTVTKKNRKQLYDRMKYHKTEEYNGQEIICEQWSYQWN